MKHPVVMPSGRRVATFASSNRGWANPPLSPAESFLMHRARELHLIDEEFAD
jgi:hypothetical protein